MAANPAVAEPTAEQPTGSAPEDNRPNVIWVLWDACRAQNLSCYGYERETTPNLDKLASDGVLFEQNYSQANGTALSVPSYMSGKDFPVLCLATGGWQQLTRTPPPNEKLLPEILNVNGYHTVLFSAHPWFSPESRIWPTFTEHYYQPSTIGRAYARCEIMNEKVFEWIDQNRQKPFFLYLHLMDTHLPHYIHDGHDQWIDREYAKDPDTRTPYSEKQKQHLRGLYDGSIQYADEHLGKLIERTKETGLYDNTIFVLSADHGECIGEDGFTIDHPSGITADELFHVPLIMAGPGIPKGVRVSSLTANVDIVPTLVDLLRLNTDAQFDGGSLANLMRQPDGPAVHEYVSARLPRRQDEICRYIVIRNTRFHLDYDPSTNGGSLFSVPDKITHRGTITGQFPEEYTKLHSLVIDKLLPKWNAYATLPHTSPRPFTLEVSPSVAVPREAFTANFVMDDNRWGLEYLQLGSTATIENCPPITLHFNVPNGEYRIEMELLPKDNGSAFRVKAEDDTEFKTVGSEDVDEYRAYADMGVYTIKDNSFDVTLDDGDHRYAAQMSTFRMIPIVNGKEVNTTQDQAERNEQLKALGYL